MESQLFIDDYESSGFLTNEELIGLFHAMQVDADTVSTRKFVRMVESDIWALPSGLKRLECKQCGYTYKGVVLADGTEGAQKVDMIMESQMCPKCHKMFL